MNPKGLLSFFSSNPELQLRLALGYKERCAKRIKEPHKALSRVFVDFKK
jgi:hypothetical protein